MGYPHDKTYLEQIQASEQECRDITHAYYVLQNKYLKDHNEHDDISLPISTRFQILGEAFEVASYVVDGISDPHHFMWDILEALLTYKKEAK